MHTTKKKKTKQKEKNVLVEVIKVSQQQEHNQW
jgi:hypothetical protein